MIPTRIIPNVPAAGVSARTVARRFRALLDAGYELRVDGQAKSAPMQLLERGYTPRYQIELFGTRFFLANLREAHDLKVMPAFIVPNGQSSRGRKRIYARVLYKDSSLVWRCASHYINTPDEQWIGKGAVKWMDNHGVRGWYSAEETTNLPYEIQAAMDDVSHRSPKSRHDPDILFLFLRNAPSDRVWPYRDFEAPREKAMGDPANRINNNDPIAWFTRASDPTSLRIAPGFEPDFRKLIDQSGSKSTFYGGDIRKFRFASRNRQVQYLFVQGPRHTWLIHPQALTVELSSYGLRTVDVNADDDISIPGYEFYDNEGSGEIDDQIPAGFAGDACPHDPDRADASPWNHRLPIVRAFRRTRWASRG